MDLALASKKGLRRALWFRTQLDSAVKHRGYKHDETQGADHPGEREHRPSSMLDIGKLPLDPSRHARILQRRTCMLRLL